MAAAFLQFMRGEATDELLRHPNCFALLALVAQRARREVPLINPYGLQVGEAMVGDPAAVGLSRQEFRTALSNLQKWGLLTTRATNKGTIAKLANSAVYDINADIANQQPNQRITTEQPDNNQCLTTNNNVINKEEINTPNAEPASPSSAASVSGLPPVEPCHLTAQAGGKHASKKPVENGPAFDAFWDLFAKKVDRHKSEKRWAALDTAERTAALAAAPAYVEATPNKKFRKDPLTWLNGKCWQDEDTPAADHVPAPVPKPAPQLAPPAPAPLINHEFVAQQEAAAAAAVAAHLSRFSKPTPCSPPLPQPQA